MFQGDWCVLDLNDTTNYYAIITCPDPKFEVNTENYSIIRTADCDPDLVKFTEVSPYHAGDLTTIELVKGDKPINVDFSDPNGVLTILPGSSEGLNLNDYDIHVDFDDLLIERVDIKKDGNVVKLTPISKGEWCDCFVPDSLEIHLRLIPNNGNMHAKPYEIPIQIGIIHPTVWVQRCLWVFVLIGVLLLLILYLLLLMHKNRFKKDAVITPTYLDYYGNKRDAGSIDLRKDGFGAWFSRWLLPWDERNTLNFDKPTTSLQFVASESYDIVNIPKEGNINPETMEIKGYDPNKDRQPKEPVKLRNKGKITVFKTDGTEEGFLIFTSGDAVDGTIFRLILGLLILASTIAIVTLIVLMIRGVL